MTHEADAETRGRLRELRKAFAANGDISVRIDGSGRWACEAWLRAISDAGPALLDQLDTLSAALAAAEAREAELKQEARDADHRIRRLEAALRVSRGWIITCSESAQARRDLVTVDAAITKGPAK